MEQVKQVLTPYCKEEGWFLVRNSISKPGVFTISVVHSSGIKHFNVERTPTTFYLKDVQFSTLDQLVRYYNHTDVPNKEMISGVRLKFPIPREMSYLSVYDDDDYRQSGSPDVYLHPEATRDDKNMRPPAQPAPLPPSRSLTALPGNIRRNQTIASTPVRPTALDVPPLQTPGGVVRRSHTFAGKVDDAGYAQIDSTELDRPHAHQMMRQIQQQDAELDDGERCDCGLLVEKSSLPRGWSIHLSQDEESYGEVYFMSPNRDTSWTLPLSISLELDAEQQDFIRDRIYEFEQRSKRTARAKMTPLGQAPPPAVVQLPDQQPDGSIYIKPSPSSAVSGGSPSRPTSVFPPTTDSDGLSERRGSQDVVYMSMNGPAGKL